MNEQEKKAYAAYLAQRKTGPRHNYYLASLKEIRAWQTAHPDRTPSLLLHACCIVCSCWPLDFFAENGFAVTIYYGNSNIYPHEEYSRRLQEVKRYLHERWQDKIALVEGPYNYEAYEKTIIPHREQDPEGWTSCFACYRARMAEAFAYAQKQGFDYCGSSLTFSRQKDAEKINAIGYELEKEYPGVRWFPSDFKKADGQKKSDRICDTYHIYRQDYCGCRTSLAESQQRRAKNH